MYNFLLYDLFWRLPIRGGSQNKGYIKIQYIHRLTDVLYALMYNFVLYDLFWRLSVRGGSQNRGYIKIQYIHWLTEKRMTLYFLVNRGIYGHVVRAWGVRAGPHYIPRLGGEGAGPQYIPRLRVTEVRRLDVTEEYTFIFFGTYKYRGI
jgi:hypothetical protein